jgi:MFS family permease
MTRPPSGVVADAILSAENSKQPNAKAWVVLAMLWFVYVLNFLDRQLLSILAKPIQDTLHVTDTQLGLISGLYFALFYCVISIPVGWLADRTNRVRVLSIACAMWSAATIGCGLGLGPTYVGAASDFFRASNPENSLQIALYSLTPFYLLAIACFIGMAFRLHREDKQPVGGTTA